MPAVTLRARLTLLYGGLMLVALVAVAGGALATIARDLSEDNAERAAAGLPPEGLDPGQRKLLLALALGLPIALAVGGAGGWLVSGRALRPLGELASVMEAVSADDSGRRVARGGGAEVDAIAVAFNALLGRLARSLALSRRFTADAAHELRTPLSSVMGRLEVAMRHPRGEANLLETLGGSLEELGRLRALLEGLLVLARSDAGQLGVAAEPVDVGALLARLVERDRAAAEERGIQIESSIDSAATDGARVRGDARLLERALGNLVGNALLHSGGSRVTLRTSRREGRVLVEIEDDGAGIPEAERARLFDRFFRGDQARTRGADAGFGLGLSIARSIAELHGGALQYSPREGGGLIFTVELPTS